MKKFSLIISSVLTLIVFSFSFATGEQSGSLSLEISNFILNIITDVFPNNSISIMDLHIIVRKSAHMFEYLLLGVSWFYTGKLWNLSYLRILIIGIMIASADEAIQTYVDGRNASIFDAIVYDIVPFTISSLLLLLCNNKKGRGEMTANTLARLQTNTISPEKAYKEMYKNKRKRIAFTNRAHFIKLRVKVPGEEKVNRFLAFLLFMPVPIFIVRFILNFIKLDKVNDDFPLSKRELVDLITRKGINISVDAKTGEKIIIKTI
jgi:VanZ family protein